VQELSTIDVHSHLLILSTNQKLTVPLPRQVAQRHGADIVPENLSNRDGVSRERVGRVQRAFVACSKSMKSASVLVCMCVEARVHLRVRTWALQHVVSSAHGSCSVALANKSRKGNVGCVLACLRAYFTHRPELIFACYVESND
jgi:hypothetical protein